METLPVTPEKIEWVYQVMKNSILSIDSSVPGYEAAKMMEDAKVGALVVMENNQLVGIITDRDFAIKVVAHSFPRDTPVRRIMSHPITSIGPHATLWVAAELMSSGKLRKLPVIDDGKVIGIITATDLIDCLVLNPFKS
jgi:CBS domain-containing protein